MEEQIEMEIDLVELFHTLVKKAWVILDMSTCWCYYCRGYTKLFITPQYQASFDDLCFRKRESDFRHKYIIDVK